MEVFHKYIKDCIIGTHRLLVLDGYNSHILPEFDRFCLNHQIVVFCMLVHLLYLLQLLDVGCFSALKQAYRHLIKQIMSRGVNYINKREFLLIYRQARQAVIYQSNIQAGFAATGLVLYDLDRVLSLLHTKYQTLLPQRPRSNASWAAETPYNITELQKQTVLLKHYLKQRTYSPLSLTK